MHTNRLVLLGLAVLLSVVHPSRAQAPAPPAQTPSFEERLAASAAENRHAVLYRNGAFSGPGWDLLVEEGRKSRFFLVGEEHGVAETPALVLSALASLRLDDLAASTGVDGTERLERALAEVRGRLGWSAVG